MKCYLIDVTKDDEIVIEAEDVCSAMAIVQGKGYIIKSMRELKEINNKERKMKYRITVQKILDVEASTMQEAIEKVRNAGKHKGCKVYAIDQINNDTIGVLTEEEVNKEFGLGVPDNEV